jgi:hypothetical protein
MTFTRASLSYLAVVGAFALGLAVGPFVDANRGAMTVAAETPRPAPAVETPPAAPTPAPARSAAPRLERVPTASAAQVQRQVKALLNHGADVRKASEGFQNGYQFMTVAYAARNTDIPFMVLKHRVVTEGQPLAAAIAEFKPELDGVAEANRARAEARADLARLSG